MTRPVASAVPTKPIKHVTKHWSPKNAHKLLWDVNLFLIELALLIVLIDKLVHLVRSVAW